LGLVPWHIIFSIKCFPKSRNRNWFKFIPLLGIKLFGDLLITDYLFFQYHIILINQEKTSMALKRIKLFMIFMGLLNYYLLERLFTKGVE